LYALQVLNELQINALVTKENQNTQSVQHLREKADEFAFPMFALSVLFLLLLAGIVITWVDMPRVAELAQLDSEEKALNPAAVQEAIQMADIASRVGQYLVAALLIMWPLFWFEFAYNYITIRNTDGSRKMLLQPLLACLIPPLRLGRVSPAWDNRMWLPSLSWQHPGRDAIKILKIFENLSDIANSCYRICISRCASTTFLVTPAITCCNRFYLVRFYT